MRKPPLPYPYLAVEGVIGAGKTTVAGMLHERYRCDLVLEAFADNPFLPAFYDDPHRYALPVELHFAVERHAQLSPRLTAPDLFAAPVLADYTFAKCWLFARMNLQEREAGLFARIYDSLARDLPTPTAILYVRRPPDVLLANIRARGRNYERGIDRDYLRRIEANYVQYLRSLTGVVVLVIEAGAADLTGSPYLRGWLCEEIETARSAGIHRLTLPEGREYDRLPLEDGFDVGGTGE